MRVVLINMPFASLAMPSLALTQLSGVVEKLGKQVQVETLYLNLDFAGYFESLSDYTHALVDAGFMTGFGDWFFRNIAFPDAPDNTEAYLDRYYFDDDEKTRRFREVIVAKRDGLAAFLDDKIEEYGLGQADVVGLTALFSQTVASFAMAQRLKQVNPEVVTVLGGSACEGVTGQEFAARVPQIDYVFCGPGLVSFPQFIRRRLEDDANPADGIAGVFYRGMPAAPVVTLGEELDINTETNLDYTSFLDKFEESNLGDRIEPCLLMETSRGCSWAEKTPCTFCGLNGLRRCHRCMDPHNAIEHISSLFRWVPRCRKFIAVDTMLPRNYIKEVFPVLHAPEGMQIMYEVRPDLDENEIGLLYNAGVVALQPGIESLSTASLRLMRKGTNAFCNISFLKAAAKHSTHLDWNLLLFSPGEDEETYEKYLDDLPRLTHLVPPNGAFPINFVRYSRYFEVPEEYDLNLEPQDFYAMTYPFPMAAIENTALHFVDRSADTGAHDYWLRRINELVDRWRDRWLGVDDRPQARLCFLEDESGVSVYDSRSGEECEHELTPFAARLLRELERPLSMENLARAMGDTPDKALTNEIADLCDLGLLFEENGRYMSLVVQ